MNVRSSTHLMRAFIKATHNHQSPIANHNASKLRGFKIGANGPGGGAMGTLCLKFTAGCSVAETAPLHAAPG
jgi:hypothetical protein